MRDEHDIRRTAEPLEAIYHAVIDEMASTAIAPEADGIAIARFVEGWLRARVYLERHGQVGRMNQDPAEHLIVEVELLRRTAAELSYHVRRLGRRPAVLEAVARLFKTHTGRRNH